MTCKINHDHRYFGFPKRRANARRGRQDSLAKAVFESLEKRVLLSTYTVNTLADSTDSMGSSTVSLRDAIDWSNAAGSDATINFSLPGSAPWTINLSSALPDLNDPGYTLAIDGPGAGSLTINGGGHGSVLAVDSGTTAYISGLTVTGGNDGGISNQGTLTIADSDITGNTATNAGGGIESSYGSLTVDDSTISGNSVTGVGSHGGGIYTYSGTASINDSVICDNTANTVGGASGGGGVANWDGCALTITNCTIEGNSAAGLGGGIDNDQGMMTVTDSTISGNSAGTSAGGIYNNGANGGNTNLYGTIVAGNNGGDVGGAVNGTYNLIQDGSGELSTDPSSHNILGENPLLAGLADNGGPTDTMALEAGSPALGDGSVFDGAGSSPINTDQRGNARLSSVPDIGAWEATEWIVNALADTTDPSGSSTVSLRDAIDSANSAGGVSVVSFAPSLTSGGAGTIDLGGSALDVSDSGFVAIVGPGSNLLSINAGGHSGVFNVDQYASAEIADLTITGGHATGGGINNAGSLTVANCTISGNSSGFSGGGIYSNGSLTVSESTISGNSSSASAIKGGGIGVYGGSADITNSTISNNQAGTTGDGGGLSNWYGDVTIGDCTISGNSTAWGGGIANYGGTLTLSASTLAANSGTSAGGGVSFGDGTNAVITNCTISGNSSNSRGGGVYNDETNLKLVDSTVSGNSATHGGGIYNDVRYGGYTSLYGTVVANSSSGGDVSGDSITGTYNLIGDGSGGLSGSSNILNENPLLAPLGNYGGPTQTMPLLPGSPAIGAGDSFAVTTDQRGQPRPNSSSGTYDIGAFQTDSVIPNISLDGADFFGQLSLRQSINLDDALGGDRTITFASFLFNRGTVTIHLSGTALALDDTSGTLAINGPGQSLLTIDGGGHSGVFAVGPDASAAISGVTISGGHDSSGGGINNNGTLTVTDCAISGNTATNAGGGIESSYGSLTVDDSTISGNSVTGVGSHGGGIYTYSGTASINDSAIYDNTANTVGGASGGGGVANWDSCALTITNCTIEGNSAAGLGGGIDNDQGMMTVTDSTISGNSAGTNAGGIYNNGANGGNTDLYGTIVAGNNASDVDGGDFSGTYNLIGKSDGTSGLSTSDHNQIGTISSPIDPKLLPLADNGGPTLTMALRPGSPAIGGGSTFNAPDGDPITTDQRGSTRSTSHPSVGAFDIGVYVDNPFALVVQNNQDDPYFFNSSPSTLTLREAATLASAWGGDQTISFASTLGTSVDLNSSLGALELDGSSGTITIEGPGSGLLMLSGSGNSGVITVDPASSADIDGLTITSSSSSSHAAIANEGTLGISNAVISGNADGAVKNGTQDFGAGTLTIDNTTISGNTASDGAGVLNYYGTLIVNDSTFNNNTATQNGGAIANGNGQSVTIANSTFTANQAGDEGGAINNDRGAITVVDSTISDNTASTSGGGIHNNSGNSADCTLEGSIVAGNTGGTTGDLSGGNFSGSYDLIGASDGSSGLSAADENQIGTISSPIDPMLGSLGNNGGETDTLPLLTGSPAQGASVIFNGADGSPITTDQRGQTRPSSAADIGAYQSFTVDWDDRRPIGMVILRSGTTDFTTGTVPIDMTPLAYAQALLGRAAGFIPLLLESNDQGMITWDLEGYPGEGGGGYGAYVGNPMIATTLIPNLGEPVPPKSDFSSDIQQYYVTLPSGSTIVDEYFAMFSNVGLETGVTIRPGTTNILNYLEPDEIVTHDGGGDEAQQLISRIEYAESQWGCTLFYIDSYLEGPTILSEIHAAVPNALLIPEYTDSGLNNAYSAPYQQIPDNGDDPWTVSDLSTPASTRVLYPDAFSVIRDSNVLRSEDVPAITQSLAGGDIFFDPGYSAPLATAMGTLAFDDATYSDETTLAPFNNDVITLRAGVAGEYEILRNGLIIDSGQIAGSPELNFNFGGTNDTLIIDTSNGNPIPSAGITFNGGSSSNGDTLSVIGNAGNSITFGSGTVSINTSTITFENVAHLVVDPRGGSTQLSINSGVVTIPAQTPGNGLLVRQFSSLSIATGATLVVGTDPNRSDMTQIETNLLSVNGTLDLDGNELILDYGTGSDPISAIRGWLTSGYNSGAWNGTGIDSSAAAANGAYALGYADGADGIVSGLSSGQIEILYTLYGDANLDGVVNSADSAIQQSNLNQTINSWDQGDFNYDGVDNSTDTALLEANFDRHA